MRGLLFAGGLRGLEQEPREHRDDARAVRYGQR
jgi:hypothetical protein